MTILEVFKECNRGDWEENPKTDTQWSLREAGRGTFYLIFPPTQTSKDWKQNFHFWKAILPWKRPRATVPYKRMAQKWKAHAGFVEKYQSVRDDIHAAVITAKVFNLVIVGYSQGGALATLALEDMKYLSKSVGIPLVTTGVVFGAPRVVGWKAPKERWKDLYRYECTGDIVAWVPPFLFGYKHVGTRVSVGNPKAWPSPMRHAAYGEDLATFVPSTVPGRV